MPLSTIADLFRRASALSEVARRYVLVVLLASLALPAWAQAGAQTIPAAPKAAEVARALPQLEALPAADSSLLSSAPAATGRSRALSLPRAVKRLRSVTVATNALATMAADAPMRINAAGRVTSNSRRFRLALFDDLAVDLVKIDMEHDVLDHDVMRAAVVGGGGGEATLVIDHGRITGQITVGDRSFGLQPDGSGVHTVVEYDPAAVPAPEGDAPRPSFDTAPSAPTPSAPQSPNAAAAPGASNGATTIRVLLVYTQKALQIRPSLLSDFSLFMSSANQTLANSNINARVVAAGAVAVTYSESDLSTMLNDATARTGDFARIAQLRADMGADLIQVWGATQDACGVGWLNDWLDQGGSSFGGQTRYGTSVLQIDSYGSCISTAYDAPTHEIGHNLGAQHDRYAVNLLEGGTSPGPQSYNYGYIDTSHQFSDVMSYGSQSSGHNLCNDQHVYCPHIHYFSNPNVTYQGYPVGIADSLPEAADNARRIGEIAPYVAQFHTLLASTASARLTVSVSGTGTVTTSGREINCGPVCTSGFGANQSVTLTATAPSGWELAFWSGACTGSAPTCTVTVSGSAAVTATFMPSVHLSQVYSSAHPSDMSLLRFMNTGSTSGTVTVDLADYATGNLLTQWTSPAIPAGAAQQFSIGTIDAGVGSSKPPYYAVTVHSNMSGAIQHVLWRPLSGSLTNLSTCEAGVATDKSKVAYVHSSLVGAQGYPSFLNIGNKATSATQVTLGIYDAASGQRLGTFVTAAIPAGGETSVSANDLEAGARIVPAPARPHYVVKVESTFNGFLQHIVINTAVGMVVDMTGACYLSSGTSSASAGGTVSPLRTGALFSSAQAGMLSFVRVHNSGTSAGTATLVLHDFATGAQLGQWTTPQIQPGASPQYAVTEIEYAAGIRSPTAFYSADVTSQFPGTFAHVLWSPGAGSITDLSTCDGAVGGNASEIANVHSSLVGAAGYPSYVIVNNTGETDAVVSLGISNAANGALLGQYLTPLVKAGGQLRVSASTLEAGAGIIPSGAVNHYVVKIQNTFTGFLQHLVANAQTSVLGDMTPVCRLPG